MGNMDQNSEVLNRAINESLKKVDRGRRRRGLLILTLGIMACMFTYGLPQAFEIEGTLLWLIRPVQYFGIACMIHGGALITLGSRARLLYLKYFGPDLRGRVVFYVLLAGLAILLDLLLQFIFV
jgi:hypothetical protein